MGLDTLPVDEVSRGNTGRNSSKNIILKFTGKWGIEHIRKLNRYHHFGSIAWN